VYFFKLNPGHELPCGKGRTAIVFLSFQIFAEIASLIFSPRMADPSTFSWDRAVPTFVQIQILTRIPTFRVFDVIYLGYILILLVLVLYCGLVVLTIP